MEEKIQRGEETAKTSALTFDEVFWAIRKHDLKLALEVCEALLNFPNLEIIPADREIALSALRFGVKIGVFGQIFACFARHHQKCRMVGIPCPLDE